MIQWRRANAAFDAASDPRARRIPVLKRRPALAGLLFLAALLAWRLPFLVLEHSADYRSKVLCGKLEKRTKVFCESLIPLIEKERSADGAYPAQLDSAWLAGRYVPSTIRTQDFYVAQGDRFFLRFYRPGAGRREWFCVWCYDSYWHEWHLQYEY